MTATLVWLLICLLTPLAIMALIKGLVPFALFATRRPVLALAITSGIVLVWFVFIATL